MRIVTIIILFTELIIFILLISYSIRLSYSFLLLVLKFRLLLKFHYCKHARLYCTLNNNYALIHTINKITFTPYKALFHSTNIPSLTYTRTNIVTITIHLSLYKQIKIDSIPTIVSPAMSYTRVKHEKHLSLSVFNNG